MTKIEAFIKLAHHLNQHQITWTVGASFMLYLRGVTDHFNDIDLRIKSSDSIHLEKILGDKIKKVYLSHEVFKTEIFYHYHDDPLDVDIMINFAILNEGKVHDFPLLDLTQADSYDLHGEIIYLDSITDWLHYYELMHRNDKEEMIKKHLNIKLYPIKRTL